MISTRCTPLLLLTAFALCPLQALAQSSTVRSLLGDSIDDQWYGNNPHTTNKAAADQREAAIADQQEEFQKHWRLENGELVNDGEGPYATTREDFGDIELQLDYRTVAGADSGIYLRGTPQIQIWDFTKEGGKWDRGANAGSGGLFNNSRGAAGQLPLRLADLPFGQWNHFRIIQVGSRTWVELNDQVVVDGASMENFWDKDRLTPLHRTGPIHLQTHGGEIRWKNIQVRDIGIDEAISRLRGDDSKYGFSPIFNGEDLSGWTGAIDDYEVVDSAIACKPGKGGVLFTKREYENFAVRFEFKLPPGGNNGLAIRYPGTGSAAYDAMCELQILDDEAEQYATLDPRQYHGSVYGIVPAHRGYLNPAGQWNYQEVIVDGSRIKVELNGTVIVDADVAQVTEYKDDLAHPGKLRTQGHFGFAGHNDPVMFRNIAIKSLPPTPRHDRIEDIAGQLIFHASFDDTTQANLSKDLGMLLTADSTDRSTLLAKPPTSVKLAKDEGRLGDALRFEKKTKEVLFYEGSEFGYRETDWSGTVSFWLKLDPNKDLEPGFCDPIQITQRAWNDGALFVDFDKELPRDFRLGVFPDLKTWNPDDTNFDDIPVAERPMVTVKNPPFAANQWTHVCFTWENVNSSDKTPATASLYLNGQLQGSITRPMQFTWDPKKVGIMVGINYIGLIDELSVFRRALNGSQVEHLFEHPEAGR